MNKRTHAERRVSALEVLDGFVAGAYDAERSALAMQRRRGALGSFAIDVVMGDVWSRPQFSRRDRSLIVISVLAAIGSDDELSLHTQVGLNHGLTRTEIEEILLHVAAYAGFPMAMKASRVIDDRFCQIDQVDRLPERSPSAFRDDHERRAAACDVRRTLTGGRSNPDPDEDFAAFIDRLGEVGRVAYEWAFGDVWARDELESPRSQRHRNRHPDGPLSCRGAGVPRARRLEPWPEPNRNRRDHGPDDHLRRCPSCHRRHARHARGIRQDRCPGVARVVGLSARSSPKRCPSYDLADPDTRSFTLSFVRG